MRVKNILVRNCLKNIQRGKHALKGSRKDKGIAAAWIYWFSSIKIPLSVPISVETDEDPNQCVQNGHTGNGHIVN
jgi:hypothetical protein